MLSENEKAKRVGAAVIFFIFSFAGGMYCLFDFMGSNQFTFLRCLEAGAANFLLVIWFKMLIFFFTRWEQEDK